MTNEKPFDVEEWLATQKKGFGGKVSREVFIAKLKELGAEIEDKRQLLEKKDKEKQEIETQLKTSQTELAGREQIIKNKEQKIEELNQLSEQSEQKIKESKEKEQELTTKLAEQAKILQSKEEALKIFQQRPDITNEKYQELLNNQEKHKEEDLKPNNLPTDWKKQLSDKKIIEKNFADIEKKISETETKLVELEKRPTAEQLQQAIQQERDKYKDYDNIKVNLQEIKRKYDELQSNLNSFDKGLELQGKSKESTITETEYQSLNQQLQTEKEKNEILAKKLSVLPPPIVELGKDKEVIIKEVEKLLIATLNPLYLELGELKKQLTNNSFSTNSELPLPVDYKEVRKEKEELLKILKVLYLKLPE